MRISQRLVFGFVSVALLTGVVGYVSVNISQKALQKAIGENSVSLAREVLNRIDSGIYGRIEELQIYYIDSEVREVTKESNSSFERLDDIQSFVNEKDAEWTSVPKETVTAFMQELSEKELSKKLRNLMRYLQDKHGYTVFSEIFVTNKYGANVAQTGKTTDYYQADEQWWQEAKENGLFVSDVEYDQSSDVYSLAIGVKVSDENGNFLGAMKAVLNIEDAIRMVKQSRKRLVCETAKVRLFDRTGKVIFDETGEFEFLDDVPGKELLKEMTGNAGYSLKERGGIEGKKLFVYVYSKGCKDYKGLGWILTVQCDAEEIFAPVAKLSNAMVYLSAAMTIGAVLIGIRISRSISKPITRLKNAADAISTGTLNTRIQIGSDDEVGELAKSFNRMAENLAKDMADRKKAEQAVQASERFLACVFDTIQEGISVLDADLTVRSVNSTIKKWYEANLPLEGKKCYQCYHNKDVPCATCPAIRCMQSGQTECEIVPGLPGSPTEWVELYSYPIKDSDSGRVTGVVEFVRDITEQKRMEKALRQSEQRFRATFEQSIDAIVLVNPDTGQIEEFNDKACQSLGYTRQEFRKLKLNDIEAIESPEELAKHMDKVVKQGMDIFETKHRTKSGEIRDVLVSAKIIYARGRKLCQSMFRDVTEQKQAKEKLHEYQTKLKSMAATSLLNEERQRRRIAHGLHDDIGQKLAVAKLDLLSSIQDGTGADTTESVKNVCSQIDAMIESVRSLTFELSNPVLTELGLEAAIERHLNREIHDKHGIEFQLHKCGRLAQLDEDMSMCLFRSVRELLNNVIRHSNAKNVSVSLDKADSNITIRVNDDGVGFDPVTVNSKINAGVGFGIFSIREQLESFAGELKVESSPGHGSSFTITVPLEQRSK